MGLRDVLRGKRRLAVADPSGEPWQPGRRQGEDTVELVALLEGPEPEGPDEDEPEPDRPTEHA